MKTSWKSFAAVLGMAVAAVLCLAADTGGPYSTGQFRAYASNTTASAAAMAAGRYTTTTLDALITGASSRIISLGSATEGPRRRGFEVVFIGVGSNNNTGNYRVWQVKRGRASSADRQPNDMGIAYIGGGTFTLSAAVGATSATTVTSSERIADTVTFTQGTASTTPKGIGDVVQTAFGSVAPQVYSPADDTPGRLWIPDMGNGDLYLELWVGTATSVNAVVDCGS